MTTRPPLAEVALESVWPPPARGGVAYATMTIGQWDALLAEAYRIGFVLLELDDNERIVKAYRTVALN